MPTQIFLAVEALMWWHLSVTSVQLLTLSSLVASLTHLLSQNPHQKMLIMCKALRQITASRQLATKSFRKHKKDPTTTTTTTTTSSADPPHHAKLFNCITAFVRSLKPRKLSEETTNTILLISGTGSSWKQEAAAAARRRRKLKQVTTDEGPLFSNF